MIVALILINPNILSWNESNWEIKLIIYFWLYQDTLRTETHKNMQYIFINMDEEGNTLNKTKKDRHRLLRG